MFRLFYNISKTMSIIYAVIARTNEEDITTLCSYDTAHGNYPTILQDILRTTKITESKTYGYDSE